MNRRRFLGSALATGQLLAAPALAAERAHRAFRILRGGSDIGRHSLSAVRGSNGFEVDIRIDIAVKVLGFKAYTYNLINRETWRDGALLALNSRVNDDGGDDFCRISRDDDMLRIVGSRGTGTAPLEAVSTSYFHPDFLKRRPWISTQSGAVLAVDATALDGNKWQISGDLETRLEYDARGEWIGTEFDASGEPARYELVEETGRIAALWADS